MKRFVLFMAGLTLAAGVASAGDLHAALRGIFMPVFSATSTTVIRRFPSAKSNLELRGLCGSIGLVMFTWEIRLSRSAIWKIRPAKAFSRWMSSATSGQATARS